MKDHFTLRAHDDWEKNDRHRVYWKQVFAHFVALEGACVEYYGADEASNEFKVDDIIFRVLEDPDDGYRSHLGVIEYGEQSNAIFFRNPLARVRVESFERERAVDIFDSPASSGYRLIDVVDSHVWLEFGTENTDDYYPYFVFRHTPKGES